jgi:hypothetical protein
MVTFFMVHDICRKLMTSVLLWCTKYQFNEDLTVLACYAVLTGTQLVMFKGAYYPNLQGVVRRRR